MSFLNILLLVFIIVCAISVALSKNLLVAIVIFMSQSLAMSVIWMMLQSPDLAITEAAVGVGIDSLLYFVTLKKIHAIDVEKEQEKGDASAKRAADRFASLLGDGAEAAPKADLSPDENYGRFCRNCVHFIEHPFRPLCGRDGRAADPMGECGEFVKKR